MKLFLILFLVTSASYSQQIWKSQKWFYTVEVPKGFSLKTVIGSNVDFKAVDKSGASVIVKVVALPDNYENTTIEEAIGDTLEYRKEFVRGGREYFDDLKYLKSGWTRVSNRKAFWFDYTEGTPNLYHKVYSLVKNDVLYTITLNCETSSKLKYAPYWYRFKDKIEV